MPPGSENTQNNPIHPKGGGASTGTHIPKHAKQPHTPESPVHGIPETGIPKTPAAAEKPGFYPPYRRRAGTATGPGARIRASSGWSAVCQELNMKKNKKRTCGALFFRTMT